MNANIVAEGVNDAWLKILRELSQNAEEYSPRGVRSKEILNASVKISNPKKRILSLPNRKISLPFAFGELMWYLSGSNDLQTMSYYSNAMKNFSDDGLTLNSAYGYRIFGNHKDIPFNQWENVIDRLKADNDTRQAIIHLHTPNNKPTKDEVCTLTLQFLIREGKLDMIVNMRSNDIVWGFTYDVFAFTTFQELIANELSIDIGDYYHNAASMHIYEKDYRYLDDADTIYDELYYMANIDKHEFSYDGLKLGDHELKVLMQQERSFRNSDENDHVFVDFGNKALTIMQESLSLYQSYKIGNKERIEDALKYDNIYHLMMMNYFSGVTLNDSEMYIYEGPDGAGKSTMIEQNKSDDSLVIHFKKPSSNFDIYVYFYTTLMTGNIHLDRFIYSEIVYNDVFKRGEPLINIYEVDMIERLLNFRDANLLLLTTDPEICAGRLDDDDKDIFDEKTLSEISTGYKLLYTISSVENKDLLQNNSSIGIFPRWRKG